MKKLLKLNRPMAILLATAAVMVFAACGQDSQPEPSGISVVQAVPSEPVVLAGEGDTAQPKPNSQSRSGGAYGFSHYFFQEIGGEVMATLIEGPAGEQVRSNLSYLQLKQLFEQESAIPEELKMSRDELGALVGQLDEVRQATEKYQDVKVAAADGYRPSGEGEVSSLIEDFTLPDAQSKVSESLVWTNTDAVPHTVTSGSEGVAGPGFDSGLVGPGQSFAFRFD